MRLAAVLRRLTAILLLLMLLAGGTLWWARRTYETPFQGYAGPEQFVVIPPGSTVTSIGRRLVEAGVVRDLWLFRVAVWRLEAERLLKAGEYRFDHPLTAEQVVGRLASGDVYLRPLSFPEGLTIDEMAMVFAEHGFGEADAFRLAARDPRLIRPHDAEAETLEGYLFPETYSLQRETTAAELVAQMVQRFLVVYETHISGAAQARGLSTRHIVTLASLIEKETGAPSERPLISAVYTARLERGMLLQADPTVIYALRQAGRFDGNLRRTDLQFDSPYNTYRYPGLPKGPIASPGLASLEAAALPAPEAYLYFVSRNDGTHAFSRTLEEHNRNVERYQVQYFRERRHEGRSAQPPGR